MLSSLPISKVVYLNFIELFEFENIKCKIDCKEIKGQTPKTRKNRVNFMLNKKTDNTF